MREPRPHDVVLDVLYCGICHTDLHMVGDWGIDFPMVPGHELVGHVREVGADVRGHAVGDLAAVSTIVASCGKCPPCRDGLETYCVEGATPTYGAPDRVDGTPTRGGWADALVADARFVHALPAGIDPAAAAPLLCAGITTWAPLRHWGVGPSSTVGVVGLGGLGHLGVKFARALGAHVVAFTTSEAKVDDALALGAHEAVLSTDASAMAAQADRLDLILDAVAVDHPMNPYVRALRLDGTLVTLGLPARLDVSPMALATGRRSIAGSGAGGTREIREMLDFCAEHDLVADVETVTPDGINAALERLARGDVRYRFVVDRTADRTTGRT